MSPEAASSIERYFASGKGKIEAANKVELVTIEMVLLTSQNLTYTELKNLPAYEYHLVVEIIEAKGKGENIAAEKKNKKKK